MPRSARVIPPQGYMHLISRGNNRRTLFHCKKDFHIYFKLLRKLKTEESIEILHYCLMPNHVHLLIRVAENSRVSRFMQRLNLLYSFIYRKRRGYAGYLWQGRFKGKIIEEDSYLIQCGKYIELNPVRAGIVHAPEEYPYSSYGYYAYGRRDEIVDVDPLYLDLGADHEKIRLIYRSMILNEIAAGKIIR